MIQITTEQFEQLLPFVGAASEDVFNKMLPDFEMCYNSLIQEVVSPELEAKAILPANSIVQSYARYYVVLATFLNRLHSQDIIMTDNGFGVVSNENIAPASQARVDAVEKELTYRRDFSKHDIINQMRRFDGWSETEQAHTVIQSFIWSPKILSACGLSGKLTFDDIEKQKGKIKIAENILRQQLSDDLIDQMLDEERCARFLEGHRLLKLKIYGFIGYCIADDKAGCDYTLELIFRFIEKNIDQFALYRDSAAYKANHMTAYENKTDDTAFFFAG